MSSPRRLFIAALIGAAAAGCAAIHRPPATTASLAAEMPGAAAAEHATTDSVVARLARRAIARADHHLDILLLSGGGQNGAYGAGFLRGWHSRADTAMPQFDLVSGISTGALQAPFALLGTSDALDTLSSLYRRGANSIAPTVDLFFWLRHTGGVLNTGRYRAMIAHVYDDRMEAALRAAFDGDRQLLIGTTDYDLGIRRTWDIATEIARAGGDRLHLLLLASSAVPTLFPPVIVDRHVHADGGVMSNVMPVLGLDDFRRLGERLAGDRETVTVRLWVIMNTLVDPQPFVTDPASRDAIWSRTTTLLFVGQQPQMLARLGELARAVTTGAPGLRMEFRATTIPQSLAGDPGLNALFDADWMGRLERIGYDRARSDARWDSVVTP